MDILSFMFISFELLFFFSELSYASDTINSSQTLSDGSTLVSNDGAFELGFFSPGSNTNRYLGIWYKNIAVKTVVWVANRLNPINDSSSLLMINNAGNLVLMNQNTSVVWSANLTKEVRSSVVLQLLDTGNLVLRDEQGGNLGSYLWQSFDYPSDTLLPGMKLGWNLKTGFERHLSAWKSPDDPSPGDSTWGIELRVNPELVMRKGSKIIYRSGPWNGLGFSGAPALKPNQAFQFNFVSNEEELYYAFYLTNKSVISRIVINETNYIRQRLAWSEETQSWKVYSYVPRDYCDNYGLCGAYGNCISSELPNCQCLKGFKYKSAESVDWSQGCVRNKPLNYSKRDGFIKFVKLKLPDTTHSWLSKSMNIKECKEKCLENSSCMAYTNSDIKRGRGCIMWFGDLIDIRRISDGGQDLYIRMSASELGTKDEAKMKILVIVITIAVAAGLLIVSGYIHKFRTTAIEKRRKIDQENGDKKEDLELPLFEFNTIANATNNFSINNKLGEGGFGPVYRGTLIDGQEIAVRRLSKISGQGFNEFKNEVTLFAKLQHRNLVKLLGCCIKGEEKLLIYEFMPNKSLDYFIFGLDPQNSKPYEYGYMAPEYASDGLFSIKSDVFSFGILMLEIVSGKRNRGFYRADHMLNFIGHAWKLWKEGKPLELIDSYIGESCNVSEVIQCIHISLLCVQQHPEDRPSMSSVVLMLGSENMLPQPKQPGFWVDRKLLEPAFSSNKCESSSTNEITISLLEAR